MRIRDLVESLRNPKAIKDLKKYIIDYIEEISSISDVDEMLTAFGDMNMVIGDEASGMFPGWNVIGRGGDGQLFSHSKYHYIVKLYRDSGYNDWVEYCIKNKGNKYLPEIKGKPVSLVAGFKVVRIEPLEEITYEERSKVKALIDDVNTGNSSDKDIIAIHKFFTHYVKQAALKERNADDLRPGNVMMRKNGQLVIIDPLLGLEMG